METLKKRADFLRVAKGRRVAMPGMMVQMAPTPVKDDADTPTGIRVGFTVTKKVGTAVVRNRARRRLRAVARQVLPQKGTPAHDYVLIGTALTTTRPFHSLLDDLDSALLKLSAPPKRTRTRQKSHKAAVDKRQS